MMRTTYVEVPRAHVMVTFCLVDVEPNITVSGS